MNRRASGQTSPASPLSKTGVILAGLAYAGLMAGFWLAAQAFDVRRTLGGHFSSAFASFACLLAPYWAFGFNFGGSLREVLSVRWLRLLAPAMLVIPYVIFALPRGEFQIGYAAAFVSLPVAFSAVLESVPWRTEGSTNTPIRDWISWQDIVVLLAVGLPIEFGWFRGAWPERGLGSMPKLLLMDAALYAFLVVRAVPGVGYDLRPRWRDLSIGLREWLLFAPLGIGLGLALGFIHFHPHIPRPATVISGWLITFFFVALPEELFFRGLLQNLIERSFARVPGRSCRLLSLSVASAIFGLSHFNKPHPFNWRYVILATIAGVFYGRAWQDRRRLLCSGIAHATVDLVWSVWFK